MGMEQRQALSYHCKARPSQSSLDNQREAKRFTNQDYSKSDEHIFKMGPPAMAVQEARHLTGTA